MSSGKEKRALQTVSHDETVEVSLDDLEPHPTLKRMPKMRDEEYAAFLKDVKDNGVKDPITCQKGGTLLDGWHRSRAQKESGLTTIRAKIVDLTEEEQEDLIYRSSALRRHLNDDQRALLAADYQQVLGKRAKSDRAKKGGLAGGRGRGKDANSSENGADHKQSEEKPAKKESSRKKAAAGFNVSERKLQQAASLLKVDSELAKQVRQGAKSLNQARRELKNAQKQEGGGVANNGGKGKTPVKLVQGLNRFLEHEELRCKPYWLGGEKAIPELDQIGDEVRQELLPLLATVAEKQRKLAQQVTLEAERLTSEYEKLQSVKDGPAESDQGEDEAGNQKASAEEAEGKSKPDEPQRRKRTVQALGKLSDEVE